MSVPLEPIILKITPTITTAIPQRLLDTTNALIIQSRQKVSNLRPEEEAARAFVCAHIACERLKTTLDLPAIQPKTPLPKKAYNLLYNQFNNALPSRVPRAPKAASSISITPEIEKQIQSLCTITDLGEKAPQYIQSGLEFILSDPLEKNKTDIPTAIVAIHTLVLVKLRPQEIKALPKNSAYSTKAEEAIEALGGYGREVDKEKALEVIFAWAKKCYEWEWFQKIGAGDTSAAETGKSTKGGTKRKKTTMGNSVGSMMQDKFDYLSERRRKAYATWKDGIMLRIKELEAQSTAA